MTDDWDFTEVTRFAGRLTKTADEAEKAVGDVVERSGRSLRDEWRGNARRTAGKHGRWYPSSITDTPAGRLAVDVGPDSGRRQGGMGPGFEYGSIHQEPHLDGTKALDKVGPVFAQSLEDVGGALLEEL